MKFVMGHYYRNSSLFIAAKHETLSICDESLHEKDSNRILTLDYKDWLEVDMNSL